MITKARMSSDPLPGEGCPPLEPADAARSGLGHFATFSGGLDLVRQEVIEEVIARHWNTIKIKKHGTAIKNLPHIFETTLRISNEKGFQAMSMRDLSQETGLSMGALYAYFSGKDELLTMLQETGRAITRRVLEDSLLGVHDPVERLRTAIRTHVFLSEAMQPWFFFSYMEARHLTYEEKGQAKAGELETERLLAVILDQGCEAGVFKEMDSHLAAALIKAMVQDWYLKRWKYTRRRVTVDQYANFVIEFVDSFCLNPSASQTNQV